MSIKQTVSDFFFDLRDNVMDKYIIVRKALEDAAEKTSNSRRKQKGYKKVHDLYLLDIYFKEKFILYSQKRDTDFRYMKYTGKNYAAMVNFFGEVGVKIWTEDKLVKDVVYTYSGRDGSFNYVKLHELRICIINNPILIEGEKKYPMAITQKQAENYLKESESNRVFCYDAITNLFAYDSKKKKFIIFSPDHPNGLTIDELQEHSEWYIGTDDGFHRLPYKYTISYETDSHTVHIAEDLEQMVNNLSKLVYEINKRCNSAGLPIIFQASWEDYDHRVMLSNRIVNNDMLNRFIHALFCYLYEMTKGPSHFERELIPTPYFKRHQFVKIVGEYRNHFSHSKANYESRTDIDYPWILKHYLGASREPENRSDFENIQIQMLQEFTAYLKELRDSIGKEKIFKGIISVSPEGVPYVGPVELHNSYKFFKGRYCEIEKVIQNSDEKKRQQYPYFSPDPEFVDTHLVYTIEKRDGLCVGYNILLPKEYEQHIGKKILIERVKPVNGYKGKKIFLQADICNIDEGEIIEDVIQLGENGKLQVKGIYIEKYLPKYVGYRCRLKLLNGKVLESYIIEGIVEKKGHFFHCGNVLLPKTTPFDLIGKRVVLKKVVPNIGAIKQYKWYAPIFDSIE